MKHLAAGFLALVAVSALSSVSAQQGAATAPTATAPVTFVADVAPILHSNCVVCHRAGEMAPMSLVTYEESRPWAKAIRTQVAQRRMPPWMADPSIGHFANSMRLADRDVETIVKWADAGAPRGEGAEPAPPDAGSGWRIGTPDLILTVDKPFQVPATGIVEYQYFRLPTNLAEDRWIQAIEIHPSDRRVVHHLRLFAQAPGEPASRNTLDPTRPICPEEACGDLEPAMAAFGPNIGSITVGTQPIQFPAGTAKPLKAGSVLTLHVHYVTIGAPVADRTQVAFVFAKKPPDTELKTVSLAQTNLVIPPGDADHPVVGRVMFQVDGLLWSLGPHTHLRGKSWRFELIAPDGTRRPLLAIPKYDFNWQMYYDFATPVPFEAGSQLEAVAVYDNSRGNKDNPDPAATVRWGEQTTDEMMFASVTYSVAKP